MSRKKTTIYISRPEREEDRATSWRSVASRWRGPLTMAAAAAGGAALARNRLKTPPPAPGTEDDAVPERSRSAMVDGVVMRWEEHGDVGPGAIPVVMVHGIPTHPRLWRFVIPALEDPGLGCMAWEMVGFGWSIPEGLDRDISVARQAEYLGAFLRNRNIEQALFVGHDLGGGVVQRFAADNPERCLGLVLVDCVAYDNWPVQPVRAARRAARLVERVPSQLLEPVLTSVLRRLGHDDTDRGSTSAELHVRPYRASSGRAGLAHQLRHLDSDDTQAVAGRLSALDVPARVVWGARDPLGVRSAERLAGELKAPLTVIPDARHFTPEDHPDVVAQAINELVAEIRHHQRMVPVRTETGVREE